MATKLCRPILLPSKDYHSQLEIDDLKVNKLSYERKQYYCKNPQQLILVSLDPNKKIKIGNKYYSTIHNQILCIHKEQYFDNEYKIIATQEQLAPEYIQQFIEEYNINSVKDVEIEIEEELWEAATFDNKYIHSTKEACLHFIEFQVYGLKNSLKQLQPSTPRLINGFVNIINNSKFQILYTENEVSNLIFKLKEQIISEYKAQLTNIDILEWFQHNKKK